MDTVSYNNPNLRIPYIYTPYTSSTPDFRLVTKKIHPEITEDQWRLYADGNMPCLWHMVYVASITSTLRIVTPNPDPSPMHVMESWLAYKQVMEDISRGIWEEMELYKKLLDTKPLNANNMLVEQILDTSTIPAEVKQNILLVLGNLNLENRLHATLTLNHENRPYKECIPSNTTLAHLITYATVKKNFLQAVNTKLRIGFHSTTLETNYSTGINPRGHHPSNFYNHHI